MKRNTHIGRVWEEVGRLRKQHGLPERVEGALVEAAFGYQVRNPRYREENGISDVVASRDFKRLCDLGFLKAVGEKRGRYYVADTPLMEISDRTREASRAPDPYDVVATLGAADQLALSI